MMQSSFIGSFPRVEKCPKGNHIEYAFIGRSNVGKSSLINFLLSRKKLAKVSSTPGKTQMINIIDVDNSWQIADLPGYGYAKLSKKHRASLTKMISNYLTGRTQLVTTFVLIDARIPPQPVDLEFIRFMGQEELPFVIVYTKLDKESEKTRKNLSDFRNELLKEWEALPKEFITSTKTKQGREELLSYIVHLTTQMKKR